MTALQEMKVNPAFPGTTEDLPQPATGRGGGFTTTKAETVGGFGTRPQVTPTAWNDINDAGAYVNLQTGELWRIPEQALVPGASPVIHNLSTRSLYVLVSHDPNILRSEAARICADNNIRPGF